MSMITATAWVPRGYAAEFPTRYELDDEELDRVSKLAKLRLDDAKEDLERAKSGKKNKEEADDWEDEDESGDDDEDGDEDGDSATASNGAKLPQSKEEQDDDLREYDLDNYDTDPEEQAGQNLAVFGNTGSLAFYQSNKEDPYITAKDEDEDEEDREDLQILPSDNLVLAAKVEDEMAHLEVYVYEDNDDNLYVHHDIMLPAIPICVEWLDIPVGNTTQGKPVDQSYKGNYVAVGTFEPDIEIWNLDMIDCMYPNAILGEAGPSDNSTGQTKKKKKKSKKANDSYHVDAVISLAANRNHRSLLASGSADKTIKLWDLATCQCAKSYSYHTDRVCSLAWHPTETTALLSGSYDRTVIAADMRSPDASKPRWGVESDVEQVRWNPHDPNYFFVSTEGGRIHYHDARNAPSDPSKTKSVWSLQAHDSEVSTFDINRHVPGYLVTGGQDKEVKLWNIAATGPSLVVSRNLNVGKVFSATFAPEEDVSFRLAVAGSRGAIQIWDTSTNAAVRRVFASQVGKPGGKQQSGGGDDGEIKERLVGIEKGVDDDDEESDSDEDDEDGDEDDESMDEV